MEIRIYRYMVLRREESNKKYMKIYEIKNIFYFDVFRLTYCHLENMIRHDKMA